MINEPCHTESTFVIGRENGAKGMLHNYNIILETIRIRLLKKTSRAENNLELVQSVLDYHINQKGKPTHQFRSDILKRKLISKKSMTRIVLTQVILLFFSASSFAQNSPELQNAINSVPFAKFDYPANRDRSKPPQVASPASFVFAYYELPYAVNVNPVRNADLNTYVEYVLPDFGSVNLSPAKERAAIRKALPKLQTLIDEQILTARMAGYADITNFSRSYISQFFSNGRVIIAIRELWSSQDLYKKLTARQKLLAGQ